MVVMDQNPKDLPQGAPDDSRVRIIRNQSGEENLRVLGEAGKWITFYSTVDIARELALLFENQPMPEDHIIVLFGLGLGHHLREIVRKTDQPVIVVERDEEIVKAALTQEGVRDLLDDPKVFPVVGKSVEITLQEISTIQLQAGLRDLFLVKHYPTIRAFPGFYKGIAGRLERVAQEKIGNKLRYKKFRGETLNIVLINSQYLMMGELINAIRGLGHQVATLVIEREAEVGRDDFIEKLLKVLIEFKPDFILTVNHLGFDREGIVTDLLTTFKIPFASWYVDSPLLIIKHYERNLSPYCTIFLWDKDYVTDIEALGFDKVYYLPLATDPHIFRPVSPGKNPLSSQANDVSFVGNSMVRKIRKRMERMGLSDAEKGLVNELGRTYARSDARDVGDILNREPYAGNALVQAMNHGSRVDLETLVMWQATQIYRLNYIQALEPFHPTIRGDSGWQTLLDDSFHLGPELSYYYDLNHFYNVSKINFNVTSTQMRTSVNQRVFDVPAAGGFLLTDYKGQLEELLEIGEGVVCYREREEVPELITFYLKHESARAKIARRGRKHILSAHTYLQRVKDLCMYMRRHFEDDG